MNHEPKERWAIVFQAEGPGPDMTMRIKIMLKRALRQYGLRCVDCRLATPDEGRKALIPGIVGAQAAGTRNRKPVDAFSDDGMTHDPTGNRTRQNQSYCDPQRKGPTP